MKKKMVVLLLIVTVLLQYTFSIYVYAAEPQIVPDGKTATKLKIMGNITDIKTGTIKGENALNSFSRFNINQDNIANLYVPDSANNLLNFVHSETSQINGILNSIKDGQVGGNIYFLNPHGIMVGPQGVVNVGSLTAVTPTADFMGNVFDMQGNPSISDLHNITEGSIPISDSGLISIAGKINAENNINLEAAKIEISAGPDKSGTVISGANFSEGDGVNQDRVNFSDVVNTNGLQSGDKVVVENGDIKISAADNFVNEGIIAADGSDNLKAGSIDIRAGNDIKLHKDSLISARGHGVNSNGGDIIIFADRNSEFNQDAVIDARGGDSGDGGFIELSAADKVLIDGGIFEVSAEEGQGGSVLIDPDDIEFVNYDYYLHGGDYYLIADKSITIGDGVIISTQDLNWSDYSTKNTGDPDLTNSEYSKGNSGNIEMSAPQITLNSGSKLLAQAINKERIEDKDGNITQEATDYQSGNITITAELSSDTPDFFNEDLEINSVNAVTSIELNDAVLKGNNITLEAKTTAENIWDYTNYFDKEDPGKDLLQASATAFGLGTGFDVGYVKSMGSSEILLQGNTDIEAGGTVDLAAASTSTATLQTIAGGNRYAGISFAYGDLESSADVNIGAGTQISAGELNLTASNKATLDVNAMGITHEGNYEAGIAVTDADVSSTAKIADGAKISTGNLVISAVNNNSFSTKASSMALEDGKAGVGAAIFTANTGAEASYAGDFVENEYGYIQNLTIEALDNTNKNITTAAATTGSNFLMKPIVSTANEGVNYVRNKIASNPGFDKASGAAEPDGETKKWKLAGAVSYADTDQSAEAYVADDTEINASGDIAISARVRDDEVQNRAVSTVVSEAPGEGSTADVSLSAAIAYGDYDHSAKAYTGDNSKITANHLGLQSDVLKPYAKDWSIGSTAEEVGDQIVDVGEDLYSVGGDVLGLTTNGYITGYANAMGSAEDANIAGAVSYLDFTNDSRAYTGRGSEIYLQDDNDWATFLPGAAGIEGFPDSFSTLEWETPLHIRAHTQTGGVYTAGNIFVIIPGTTGGKGSVGAGYNQVNYNNNTKAFISEGTVIKGQEIEQEDAESGEGAGEEGNEEEVEPIFYNPDITVTAHSRENIISVSPTAGTGSSWGLNGTFSLGKINNKTEASIDDEAHIDVGAIDIEARDEINNWSLSGAFNLSNNVGVGTGTAINNVNTATEAFIGDNDNNFVDGSQLLISDGEITADQIDINALTEGKIKSIAVAGAVVRSVNPYSSSSGIMTKIKDKLPKFGKKTSDSLSEKPVPPARPKFGLGVSGSVAYNITDLDTSAFSADSLLDFSGENAGGLNMHAINNTDITAGSGAGALVMANSPASNFSVGIAGSVAINDLTNTTLAYGSNVTVVGADDIDLKALSGGEALAVAIGAQVNASADQDTAAGIAGSVSVNMTENDAKVYLDSSEIYGNSSEEEEDESNLNLTAYDRSRLGTGSGSLLGGGRAGIGTAISYSSINNNINSFLAGTKVSDFDRAQIHTLNNSRIGSGGGMAALAGGNSNTLAGSFVINEISNTTSAEIREGSAVTVKSEIDIQARDTEGIDNLDNIIRSQPDSTILDYDGDAIYGEVYKVKDGDTLSSIAEEYNTTEERLRELNNIEPADDIAAGQELVIPVSAGGSSILGVAGLVQISGNNAGISMVWNNVGNDFTASVYNSRLETTDNDGQINVKAFSSTDITGMALGAGISLNQFAGAGSVVVNEIKGNNTRAEVYSDSESMIISDHLNVEAEDNSSVDSLAGQVTASVGSAAVGAAVISNQISNNSVEANISGVDLGVEKDTLIKAVRSGKIRGLAASAAGSAGVALNGSVMHSSIANITRANLIDIKSESETNLLTVEAEDNTDLQTISGSAAIAGGGAIGGAVTINNIDSSTEANVRGGSSGSPLILGGLEIKAAAEQAVESSAYQGSGGYYLAAGAAVAENNVNYDLQTGIEKGSNIFIKNDGTLKLETVDDIDLDSEARGYQLGGVAAGMVHATSKRTGDTAALIGTGENEDEQTSIELDGGQIIIDSERKGKVESFTQAGSGGVLNLLNASNSFAEERGKVRAGLDSNVHIKGTTTWYGYDWNSPGTGVDITATGKPQVSARAEGYNGSLTASAGQARAEADANLDIEASVGTDSSITAENLSVKAFNKLNNGNNTARSFAQAIGGGVLLGASAAESRALSSSLVKSYIASDINTNINNNVEIIADNQTSQHAQVTGIIAGAAAIGGNWAEARSDSTTVAAAGSVTINNVPDNVGGKEVNVDGSNLNMIIGNRHYKSGLAVHATGNDYNYADSISGSGGVVVGAAASSDTISNSTTVAEIGKNAVIGRAANRGTGTGGDPDLINIDSADDVLVFEANNLVSNIVNLEQIDLSAEHHTLFNSTSNSVQAAVAGKSGAHSQNTVSSQVEANVGEDAGLYTADSYYKPSLIQITANNIIDQIGNDQANAKAAGGGVITGSAAESKSYITEDTSVNIGDNAVLFAFGDPGKGINALTLNVYNSLNIDDEAILSTGGAVDSPYAETLLQAGGDSRAEEDENGEKGNHYLKAGVNIGSNTSLISFGRIEAGAYAQTQVKNKALVKTYGGVGFAGGKATSIVDSYQDIELAANSFLLAYNNIDLRAGQKGDGSVYNRVNSSARSEVFNYTAAPLDTSIEAYGEADSTSKLKVGEGAVIDGVSDLTLGSYKGNISAEGYGVGHNPYLEVIGSKKTGGESNPLSSSDFIMNGEAGAGIFHHRSLIFNADGSVSRENLSSNIYNNDYINPYQQLQDEIEDLEWAKERAENSNDQVEVSRLEGEIQVLTMLQNMMTDSNQTAIEVNNIFASGGNITVDTDSISGDGTLNVYGGPKIEIINNTSRHLLLNEIFIPDRDLGGEIRFEGAADKASTGLNINDDEGEKTSRVIIKNNSTTGEPAIFLKGGLYNSRGLVDIFNREGSLAMFDQVSSSETRINVPNGAVIVNNPYGMYSIKDPMAIWYSEENLPETAWEAAQYVANVKYEKSGSGRSLNDWLRDSKNYMYAEKSEDGDVYATSGGDTYVFGSWFPNVWDPDKEENINHDIKLFKGFWMKRVNNYQDELHRELDIYPDQGSSDTPALSGQVIGINADTININAKMRAGSPVNWDIILDSDIDSWLSDDQNYDIENGKVVIPTEYYQTGSDISEREVPILEYDFNKGKLILADINARGGGYVYLNGEIVSTSTAGEIEVLNGLGNVEINNQSSKPLLLNNINTGSTSEGIIKIVDTRQGKTTWYVNRPGEDIKQYQLSRITNTVRPETPNSEYSSGEVSYSPEEGLRYKWKRTAELYRNLSDDDGWVELTDRREDGAGYSVYNFKTSLNPWNWINKSGDSVTDGHWVNSSLGIVDGDKDDPVFKQDIEGEVTSWDHDRKIIQSDGSIDYKTLTWNTSVDWDDWKNKGVCKDLWYYYIPSELKLTVTNSVKADNDIAISFSGSSNARLEINSDPGLTLGGRIDNIKGDTTLRTDIAGSDQYFSGEITQHSTALINTRDLNIYSDSDIGSITRPVEVDLDGGLTVNSINGDIAVTAPRNTLQINTVNSDNGDVYLSAAGNLISSSSTAVNGADISLLSEGGSIGTAEDNLQIQATGDVSLEARDDINLEKSSGDLRLLKAYSGQGDVSLLVNNGRIIDAVREREVDEEKQQQLADIWDRLRLTEEQGALADAEDTTISPYEQKIERAYDQYWYLIENGEVDTEGNFQLNTEAIDLYRPRVGEEASDAEVKSYTADMFAEHRDLLDEKLEQGWENEGYQSNFNYTVSSIERDELTEGAAWTKKELEVQINRNALITENTQFVGGSLNLAAENIDLYARGSIGTYKDPLIIYLNSEKYREEGLTVEEKAALAGANLPNDIEIIKDDAGQPSLIKIRRLRPLYTGARESISTINESGNTFIYNSEGSLNINQIQSSGELRLLARDDIINHNPLNRDFAITAADDSTAVVLEAAGGSIGTEEAPLTVKNGYLATGRARNNIYLKKTLGDLCFNRISAGNIVNLISPGDFAGLESGLSILADSIHLNAGGDIYGKGFENSVNDHSLQIELKTGKLSAQTGGNIDLASAKTIMTGPVEADNIDLLSRMTINISDRLSAADTVNLSGSDIYEVNGGEGYIEAGELITKSTYGQVLNADNRVKSFQAVNNINGDIKLTNMGVLDITGINQNKGNVEILNSRDLYTTGIISTEAGQIKLTAGGAEEITGEISTGNGRIDLKAEDAVKITDTIRTGSGNISIDAGESTIIAGRISAGNSSDINVQSGADTSIEDIITTAANVYIIAGGAIIESGEGKILQADLLRTESKNGQFLNGDNTVRAFTAANKYSGNIELKNAADRLLINAVEQSGGDLIITNSGNLDLNRIETDMGDINLTATKNINTVDEIKTVGGEIKLFADEESRIAGRIYAGMEQDITVKTGTDVAVEGVISTAGDITIDAGDSIINLDDSAESKMNAGNINLWAGKGSIGKVDNYLNIDSSNPGFGIVNASADENIYLRETEGEINIGEFIAGNNLSLTADISVFNRNDNSQPNFRANRITLISENGSIGEADSRIKTMAVETTDASAKYNIYLLETDGDLNANFLNTENSRLDLLVPAGDLRVAEINTTEFNALLEKQGASAEIIRGTIAEEVNIQADNLAINELLHTGNKPLVLLIKGGSKNMADNVNIKGSSEVGIDFKELTADFAYIDAGVDNLRFLKTRIGSRAEFNNNYYSAVADNINKKLFACDLQLFPQEDVFYLIFNADKLMLTDAMKVNYNPDFIANEFSTENSFLRLLAKMQMINDNLQIFTIIDNDILLRRDIAEMINLNLNQGDELDLENRIILED